MHINQYLSIRKQKRQKMPDSVRSLSVAKRSMPEKRLQRAAGWSLYSSSYRKMPFLSRFIGQEKEILVDTWINRLFFTWSRGAILRLGAEMVFGEKMPWDTRRSRIFLLMCAEKKQQGECADMGRKGESL